MRPIWIVAKNTFKEVTRDRILYGLIIFAVMIIFFSLALGQLSFAEQSRISANFGLSAIHLGSICIAIFLGSTLVTKELDKQTILTLLVRPISRWQFILGKFIGLVFVILEAMAGLALVLGLVFFLVGMPLNAQFFLALLGILIESMCLLSVTLLFSLFTRPILVVSFSVGIFLIGHWISTLQYFSSKMPGSISDYVYKVLRYGPDFETINWKSLVIYNDRFNLEMIMIPSIYVLLWTALLLALSVRVFERKDLV